MPPSIEQHRTTADLYYRNGVHLCEGGEPQKGGELLWGSTTQLVKALATIDNQPHRAHKKMLDYVERRLAIEFPALDLWTRFKEIKTLHINFYEDELSDSEIKELKGKVFQFNTDLSNILGKKISVIGEPSLEGNDSSG